MKQVILLLLVTSFCSLNFIQAQTSSKPTNEEQMWHDSGFNNAIVSEFNVDEFYTNSNNADFTHAMDLTLVCLRGTSWNQELVYKTIKRVAEVFAEGCGIKIGSAKYIEADALRNRIHLDIDERYDLILALRAPTKNRPIIFFFESYTHGGAARAASAYLGHVPPVLNSVFISAKVNSEEYRNKRESDYSPTAHELAHLLCDSGHIDGKEENILSGYYDLVSSTFTNEQIEVIKKSPFLRKL